MNKKKVFIIGAGQAGITAAYHLLDYQDLYDVTLVSNGSLTNTHEVYTLRKSPNIDYTSFSQRMVYLNNKSIESPWITILKEADIILLATPVHKYRYILQEIKEHDVYGREYSIGTLHGQGFFNLMASRFFKGNRVNIFSPAFIPWLCKFSSEDKLMVSVHHQEKWNLYHDLNNDETIKGFLKHLSPNCVWDRSNTYLEISLNADNPFIHLPRLYELVLTRKLNYFREEDIPYFYRDYGELACRTFNGLQSELNLLKDELDLEFALPYEIMEMFNGNLNFNIEDYTKNTLSQNMKVPCMGIHSKTHTRWQVNPNCRQFIDDLYYGLKPVIDLFEIMGMGNPSKMLDVYKTVSFLHESHFNPKVNHTPNFKLLTYNKSEIFA